MKLKDMEAHSRRRASPSNSETSKNAHGNDDDKDKSKDAAATKWRWPRGWSWRGRWRWKKEESACAPSQPSILWPEIRRQAIYLAAPAALANAAWLARFATTAASVSASSAGGAADKAGAALALTIANATGWTILLGLATGLEAVSTQLHGGGGGAALLRRSVGLLLVASFSIAAAWSQAHRLLHGLIPPPVSRASHRFLLFLLPDLAATCLLAPLRAHFRAHSMHAPLLTTNLAALAVHMSLLRNYAVHPALALSASDALLAILLAAYLFLSAHRHRRHLNRPPLSDTLPWRQLVRIAVPSSLLACTEAWFYDVLAFLSRLLSPNSDLPLLPLAVLHAVQAALASSASSRVAHELGASRPAHARSAAHCAAILAATFGCATVSAAGWLLRGSAALPPAVAVAEAASFLHLTAGGVLRGSGRAWEAAMWNAVGLLGVGLASGSYMGFRRGMGQTGLWVGMAAGVAVAAAGSAAAVLRTDWGKKAAEVERMLAGLGAAAAAGSAKSKAAAPEEEEKGRGEVKAWRRVVEEQFADGNWREEEKMGGGGGGGGRRRRGGEGGGGGGGGGGTGTEEEEDLGHCWEVSLSMMNESMRKCAAMATRSLQQQSNNSNPSSATSPPPSPPAPLSSSSVSNSFKQSLASCALKRKFFRRLRLFAASRPTKKRQKQP